ncbi:MAG TPA: D-Ala-D-Ala carboxypeptidase family metallohydrolase [bacterium]|nr:D-Ala-D-Ala carboxypeptidase family metallohydrolase [bacterium]
MTTTDYARLRFAAALWHLVDRFPGMSVTSWGRSPAHNAAVGGLPASQHLTWTAGDVVWDAGTRPDNATLEAAAHDVGLDVYREPDHDHLQLAHA